MIGRAAAPSAEGCCTSARAPEPGIAGRCKRDASRGVCARPTSWHAKACVVACGQCTLCDGHPLRNAYLALYNGTMPELRRRRAVEPPARAAAPSDLLLADGAVPWRRNVAAGAGSSAADGASSCGTEAPPPAHSVAHGTEIFAAVDGSGPPIFGAEAEAALAAAQSRSWGNVSVLFLTHSHRQLDEYVVGADMFSLVADHPLVAHSAFAAISNNAQLSTFALMARLRRYPQRMKYLVHTTSNAHYWCGEFFSLHMAMRLWSKFTWVVYTSGPDVYLTPDAVLRLGQRLWSQGGSEARTLWERKPVQEHGGVAAPPPSPRSVTSNGDEGSSSRADEVWRVRNASAAEGVAAHVAALAKEWAAAASESTHSRSGSGSGGGGRAHPAAVFIADPFPAPKHHTRYSMDAFAFWSRAFLPTDNRNSGYEAEWRPPASLERGKSLGRAWSLFGEASMRCRCEGRYRLTESILGEVVTRWNLSTALIGGRAAWGRRSHHEIGSGGLWHCHNASLVADFVQRCAAHGRLVPGFVGCSGAVPPSTNAAEEGVLESGDGVRDGQGGGGGAGGGRRREVLDLFSYGGAHYDRTLLLRLHELAGVVDRHVLIELGSPLSLNSAFVLANRPRLRWDPSAPCWRRFLPRIVHVALDGERLLRGKPTASSAQAAMRTVGFAIALERALQPASPSPASPSPASPSPTSPSPSQHPPDPPSEPPEAWVLLSDIDEIPRAASLARLLGSAATLAALGGGDVVALEGPSCYYSVDCCAASGSREAHWMAGPKLTSASRLRRSGWEALRTFRVRNRTRSSLRGYAETVVPRSSWHLGYLMTPKEMVTKLCLNTDPAVRKLCAQPDAEQRAAAAARGCFDLFGRKRVPLSRTTTAAAAASAAAGRADHGDHRADEADAWPAFAREHPELFVNITAELAPETLGIE